ncbi:MAG: Gfo/Idh/MocA family oxidoreductase [Burkholderiales bacterium]|nr:Gfo/Idh/MocA family oxidoreductase [Phycisphaerae bacterium]
MDDHQPLAIGIVGYGRIGNEHAGWINASRQARVAAIYDPTPQRVALARSNGLTAVQKMDQLLDDPTIDAVLIATPTSMHFGQAIAALHAGKHVMVEKPMALDLPQSREMAALAAAKGRVLSVFHCRRWDIDYLTVRQAIASGQFGKIINIESRLGQWSSCVGPAAVEYRPGWRNEASFGGGGLYDWGSHFIDQLWQLLLPARPVRVWAQLRGNVWTHDCDDFARVCIDFDNGAVGLCEINTTTTHPLPRWHIDGDAGSGDAPFSLNFDTREWAKLTHTAPNGASRLIDLTPRGLNETDIWDAFALACRGKSPPPIDVASVLVTMTLLDAARASSAEGRSIDVSTMVREFTG